MLELDQILRANELSISLVAAVPALLLGWTLLRGLWLLLLSRRPPDPRREAMPCRCGRCVLCVTHQPHADGSSRATQLYHSIYDLLKGLGAFVGCGLHCSLKAVGFTLGAMQRHLLLPPPQACNGRPGARAHGAGGSTTEHCGPVTGHCCGRSGGCCCSRGEDAVPIALRGTAGAQRVQTQGQAQSIQRVAAPTGVYVCVYG